MTQVSSQVTALVQPQKVGQVEVVKNVFSDAFGVWGVIDYVGSGNAVVRLKDTSNTLSETDFTATELTDGTFTSWLGSININNIRTAKLYNQLGDSTLDFSHPSSNSQPRYYNSDNSINFNQAGYFGYHNLIMTNNGATALVEAAFDDNTHTTNATLALAARKQDSSMYGLPVNNREMLILRDNYTPYHGTGAKHVAIVSPSGGSMYGNADIGISAKDNNETIHQESIGSFDHSTFKTYVGGAYRTAAQGVVQTNFNFYVNGTEEIDTSVTTLGNSMDIGQIQFGNNRFVTQGCAIFKGELTAEQHAEVHTIMSAGY